VGYHWLRTFVSSVDQDLRRVTSLSQLLRHGTCVRPGRPRAVFVHASDLLTVIPVIDVLPWLVTKRVRYRFCHLSSFKRLLLSWCQHGSGASDLDSQPKYSPQSQPSLSSHFPPPKQQSSDPRICCLTLLPSGQNAGAAQYVWSGALSTIVPWQRIKRFASRSIPCRSGFPSDSNYATLESSSATP
jgi:hypothetical protein